MTLKVQGTKNFTVSDRMKAHIEKRISKINYFKTHILEIDFHLEREKLDCRVDVTIVTHKFGTMQFSATDREMYSAIDKVIHKIDVKINREKSKITDHGKMSHEDLVVFYNEHESNNPEPTAHVDINTKPTTLEDAYLEMTSSKSDFLGFTYLAADKKPSSAFFRKLDDDVVYLFIKESDSSYVEYAIDAKDPNSVKMAEKIRSINLKKLSLIAAQKEVLEKEYFFDIYIDAGSLKVSFLFKENNGKWVVLA